MKYLGLALLPLMAVMTTAQAESAFDPQGQYLLGTGMVNVQNWPNRELNLKPIY